MGWTNPRTWVTNEVVTAAIMNAHVRDNLNAINGFVRKSADESVASSTVLQNDDHLFLPLAANGTFVVEGLLVYNGQTFAAGPGDLKVDWTLPAGATMRWVRNGPGSNTPNGIDLVVTDNATIRALGTYGAATDVGASFRGWITTGATAGTLQMRWAQNASTGVATTIRTGSFLRLIQVA